MINKTYTKRDDGAVIHQDDEALKQYMQLRNRVIAQRSLEERIKILEQTVASLVKRLG